MADMSTNIDRAVICFEEIKAAIEEAGVPVGNTPAAQYPDKIALIPGQPAELIYCPQGRVYVKNIVLPQEVTVLGDYAFAADDQIRSVKLPAGLVTIGESAFDRCARLAGITLPAGLTEIKDYAFNMCESLKEVDLSPALTTLGICAFQGSGIDSAQIPDSVTGIGVGCFQACTDLVSVKLPSGLTQIPSKMFYGCSNLPEITIPKAVTVINGYAFAECEKLTDAALPTGLKSIGNEAFRKTSLKSAVIPDGAQIGRNCFSECSLLTDVTLPSSLTVIPQAIFQNCSSLHGITLPMDVTEIQTNAFYGCAALNALTFPKNLKVIGQSAFAYSGIEEAILPEGLETIGYSGFYRCDNLKKLHLPASLNTAPEIYIVQDEVTLGKGFHLNLDISYSTKYTVQMLLDCIYNFEDRTEADALTFKIGTENLNKLKNVYVAETATGLEAVEQSTSGAILATQYAKNKNINVI